MSPRPGRIERIVEVDLPRPRGLEARALEKFDDAVAAITEIFLARGVLHSGTRGPKLLHSEEA
jgi:NitT/TauT family transport system ATP-binding protein